VLRFVPDTWADGLLRPFLLADPVAGLYSETHAPDWRFAALALLLALAWLAHRSRALLTPAQWRLLLGLTVCFYVWTFVSGNARYFLWGLLVVGPLVVVVARRLPATRAMRNTVLVGVLAVQGAAISMTFEPNVWGLRPWIQGPGLDLAQHPVRERPAVFLTIGAISYSIVVPAMHPQSRWANIAGQQDLVPGMREHAQLQALLDGDLPVYVMVRANNLVLAEDGQPSPQARVVIARALQRQGLAFSGPPCQLVQTRQAQRQGFFFCPVQRMADPAAAPVTTPVAPELDDVFASVEQRCPRFFPPGSAHTRQTEDAVVRHYSHSDTSVWVDEFGNVVFKNFRALNPSLIASVAEVRGGRFELDCVHLPGRYEPPWRRD
jgi:hypothetical protein